MLWHIVTFDFTGVDHGVRADIERQLTSLVMIDEVTWLRVATDIKDPNLTGMLTAFEDRAALQSYQDHTDHKPVVEAIAAAGVKVSRLDIETGDAVGSLP